MTARIAFQRIVISAALSLAILYAGDTFYLRDRMLHPTPTNPLETLTAPRLLAIPEKGGKTSYEIDQQNPQQTLVCVHSLFPHYGYPVCWYHKSRFSQPIPMVIFPEKLF